MKKGTILFLVPLLSLLLLSSQTRAFEPVSIVATLLGAVISPVVCKEIGCTKDTYITLDRTPVHKRLKEMRNTFKWDDYFINNEGSLFNRELKVNNRRNINDAMD